MNQKTLWILCRLFAALVLVFILLIPAGKTTPMIAGMPYALWTGLLASVILTLLTWWGTRIQPINPNDKKS